MRVTQQWYDDYCRKRGIKNHADGVVSGAEPKPNHSSESVATAAGEAARQGRCRVRVTSLRSRLLDRDNLFVKDLIDALKDAGIITDDSERWIDLEVTQGQVEGHQSRTMMEIELTAREFEQHQTEL